MTILDFPAFDRLYRRALDDVWRHWTPRMQSEMALHCHAWAPGSFDFRNYLQVSSRRFYRAYRAFAEQGRGGSLCDVGGFWGVFPVAMLRLGWKVTLTESLKYYGDSFRGLFDFIREEGVAILDYDPFSSGNPPGPFDALTVMAVMEHYPHSLRIFMENLVAMAGGRGLIFLEVPNIAYWPKRLGLLRGRTPLASVEEIYRSRIPFIGHHHEFTREELRRLAGLAGLSILREESYNYSFPGGDLRRFLVRPLEALIQTLLPDTRECLAVLCRRKGGQTAA